jgi:peptidoglycan hydrolase CwlO-like protein
MDVLAVLIPSLLSGGLILAWIGAKKAPVERDSLRVDQADKVTDGALSLLEQERERFREQLEPLIAELEALRKDRQHDREKCRQLMVANQALQDEIEERDRRIAQLRATLESKGAG